MKIELLAPKDHGQYADDQDVLAAIERICGDDFCEDMDLHFGMHDQPDSELKTAISKLSDIYRLAHAHVLSHSCYHVHEDWRKEVSSTVSDSRAPE